MPFLAPLIPAAVGAIGGAAASAIQGGQRSSDLTKQQGFAAQQGALAQQNAQNALQTPQVQAAQEAARQQALFAQAAASQGGLQNQSGVFGQQQALANQLAAQTQGQGPNPAQAMLAQQTGANTANQAALMAGQRGAGANAGLIARQISQQGAANQQAAVGQGATLQAQQQLAAQQQLQAQQQAMANLATTQVGQQANALNSYTQGAQNNQAAALGTLGQANQIAGNLGQQALSGQQAQNQQGQSQLGGLIGGAVQGIGAGVAGMVSPSVAPATVGGTPVGFQNPNQLGQHYAEGGPVGPKSSLAKHFYMMAKGGKVPAMVSPGEKIIPRSEVKAVAEGKKDALSAGKKVPGKAKVSGAKNSYANDTVPKDLNEGDIVLPRSVTQAKNPHWAAHQFVAKIMQSKGLPTRKPKA